MTTTARRTANLALVVTIGVLAAADALAYGSPTWVQEHYRWRNDNGSESAATWQAAADTSLTGAARGQNIRLRFCISNSNAGTASGTLSARLEYATSTSGPWTALGTDGSGLTPFEMSLSPNYADGAATTDLLTGTGTFVAGKMVEKPSNTTAAITVNTNQHSNVEYCFQATAKARGGMTYYFRVTNAGTALNTYSKYAALTMVAGEAGEPPVIVSPLTAQASTQAAFSYTILATGSEPITYGASGLPAGLSFDGARMITGQATAPGTYPVALTASNAWGVATPTLTLTVMANVPPTASNQTASVVEAGEAQIDLAWSDPDNPALAQHSFTILTQPAHGVLESYVERYPANTNYPARYYYRAGIGTGANSFTWKCRDLENDSNVGTCTITVTANTVPVANNQSATASYASYPITLSKTDPDAGQTFSYELVLAPSHGSVSMPAPTTGSGTAYYTPAKGYGGSDSFRWRVNDGVATSGTATVTITVPSTPPVPQDQTAAVQKGVTTDIPGIYTGGGGYTLTLVKVSGPSSTAGTVTVNGDNFHYVPNAGFTGTASFTWKINYSTNSSDTATCTMRVTEDPGNKDWPQWRFDEYRTAATMLALPAELHLQWRRDLPAPASAWTTREYIRFDQTYRPVVMGKTVFVPMNSADCLAAFDTDTGAEKWRFYAGGPVRCAPAAVNGKVYFGSDDGWFYCVNAADGSVAWKFHAATTERKVMGNNRLISNWPVRGGVVYKDGKVWFGAGLWTMEGVFLFCLDAETGAVVWKNDSTSGLVAFMQHERDAQKGFPPQGSFTFAYDDTRIYVPSGMNQAAQIAPLTGNVLWWDLDDMAHSKVKGRGWWVDSWGMASTVEPMAVVAGARTYVAADAASLGVSGTVGSLLVADDKFLVMTTAGSLYCFGGATVPNPPSYPVQTTPLPNTSDSWTTAVQNMLSRDDLKQGLALVWGIGSGRLVEELVKQTTALKIVAADSDPAKVQALRQKMDAAGLYGSRVAALAGNPMDSGFAPYQAGIIASEDAGVAGLANGQSFAEKLYRCTRPFGGEVWIPTTSAQHSSFAGWVAAASLPLCEVARNGSFTQMKRTGLTEEQAAIKPPLGMLWYGNQGASATAPVRGRVGTCDLYTSLTLTADTPGSEPYRPPEAICNWNSVSFPRVNPLYGWTEEGRADWVENKGCDTGRTVGPVHIERSGGFTALDMASDSGHIIVSDSRSSCGNTSANTGNGIIYASCPGCDCSYTLSGAQFGLVSLQESEAEGWSQWWDTRTAHEFDETPIKRLGVNFGAPADRHLNDVGVLWIHYPRLLRNTRTMPVPVSYRGEMERRHHHMTRLAAAEAPERRWVSAPCVKGMSGLTIGLASPVVAAKTASAPVLDAALGDACWQSARRITLPTSYSHVIMMSYDDENLYIAGDFMIGHMPMSAKDQWFKVRLNTREKSAADVVLGCSGINGKTSDGIPAESWSAVGLGSETTGQSFRVEMAIPWSVLGSLGFWKEQLVVNVSATTSGTASLAGEDTRRWTDLRDAGAFYLVGSVLTAGYAPIYLDAARGEAADTRPYRVRLYFAETEGANAGERVFDVKLQGQTVLSNFDIASAAGGQNRQVVREFANVAIRDDLDIDFVTKSGVPIISGVEIVGMYETPANQAPVAAIESSPSSGAAPLAVAFSARQSSDPDGQIVDCMWDFGDGSVGRGSIASHVYAEPGTYKASVMVIDNRGAAGSATAAVTVSGENAAFVCKIRAAGGDYTKLSTWETAIESDLTSITRLFAVSSIGTYTNSDNGKTVTFTGGGTGTLRWLDMARMTAAVWACAGTNSVGTVTIAGGHTFTISDTGTATESLLFTVSNRGTYDPATDDGKEVTFAGGGKGTLKHINTSDIAYVTECRGAAGGTATCESGHSFAVSGTGRRICLAVAEGYNDWPATGLADGVSVQGWFTDENHTVLIRAAAGHRHTGAIKNAGGNYTGFALKGSTGISTYVSYLRVDGLLIDGGQVRAGKYGSLTHCIVRGNMVRALLNSVTANTTVIDNGFVVDSGASTPNAAFYNCTAVDGTTCFSTGPYKPVTLFNCLARPKAGGVGFTSDRFNLWPFVSHCASSDGTADDWEIYGQGREGNLANRVFTFVNEALDDFRLAETDSGARGCGTAGLGADIEGMARQAPYDIGADEAPDNADTDGDGMPDTTDPDDDNDGMPDVWEAMYAFNQFDGSDAAGDADGDGVKNVEEYVAGTNPRNAGSRFQCSGFSVQGGDMRLVFDSVSGRLYGVYYKDNLLDGQWLPLQTNISGTGNPIQYVDSSAGLRRFYRLKVRLP